MSHRLRWSKSAMPKREKEEKEEQRIIHADKLPNELLSNIFELCIPALEPPSSQNVEMNQSFYETMLAPNAFPLSLIRVCRRWYSVAIHQPPLWSNIVIPLYPSSRQIQLAILQLDRSAHSPLSFYMGSMGPADTFSLLEVLFRQCHRWKVVCLPQISNDIEIPNVHFPLLDTLACHTATFASCFPPLKHSHYPRLSSLMFLESTTQFNTSPPTSIEPDLSRQITQLTLQNFQYHEIFPLLTACSPFLQSLEICYQGDTDSFTTLWFPELRRLRMRDAPQMLIRSFKCPCLEELVLLGGNPFLIAHMTLKSLEVSWSYWSNQLFVFLPWATTLESLIIHVKAESIPRSDPTIERLFKFLSTNQICPQLTTIDIRSIPPNLRQFNQVIAFLHLVRSRSSTLLHASIALQNFYMGHNVRFQPDSLLQNQAIRNEFKCIMNDLRKAHPNLDLQASYEFENTGSKKRFVFFKKNHWALDLEKW